MTELSDRRHKKEGYIDPTELSPDEVLDVFFAELRHPASLALSRSVFAEFISIRLGAQKDENLNFDQLAWQERMRSIMVDVDGIEDDVLDEWLRNDYPLKKIYDELGASKANYQEKESERRALMTLRHLRGGILERRSEERHDEEWIALINRLAGR